MARKKRAAVSPERVEGFVKSVFAEDFHAKRVASVANATTGVLMAASLTIHAIGRGLAAATGMMDKHAVKQVDRLLSNAKLDMDEAFRVWVPYVIGARTELYVNMDWSEFDADDHSMLVLSLQTQHGRATPLLWKTVVKSELKNQRNAHDDALLKQLRDLVPREVHVTIVADRGFADQDLYDYLVGDLGFDFIIRSRGNIHVTDDKGETRLAKDWVGRGGRMRQLRHAQVTQDGFPVGSVVVVRDKGMKDIWCLVTSSDSVLGSQAKKIYGRRFTCEETFRDVKDLRFGLGMKWTRIRRPERRDRMMLIATLAHVLLTLLGEAGERVGLDRVLKTNTSKRRQLSLFRQGLRWYDLIPNMPAERLRILMKSFDNVLAEHRLAEQILGVV